MKKAWATIAVGTALLLGAFQNCGKLGFSTGSSTAGERRAGVLGVGTGDALDNFACGSYQELPVGNDGVAGDVPARGDDGACFFVKLIPAVTSADEAVTDPELVSHAPARRLAERTITFTARGPRAIQLSSSVALPAPIDVGDLLIAALAQAGLPLDPSPSVVVSGDPTCGVNGRVALFGNELTIQPIDDLTTVANRVTPDVPQILSVRADTCHDAGHVSDVFAIFR